MNMKKLGIIIIFGAGLAVLLGGASLVGYRLGYKEGARQPKTANATGASPGSGGSVVGLSREAILQMLPGKTWYMHWENTKDRSSPTEFVAGVDGKFREEKLESRTYRLELRWVLNDGIHLFVPINEYTIRGCFIPNGRPKGFFADKPTNSPPRLLEGSPKPVIDR